MNPKVWGKHAWIFLHSITLNYPECPSIIDKENMKNFFTSVGNVLPCYGCKKNFTQHLIKYPLNKDVLSSRSNLFKWLVDIHNEVNSETNKPILSYEQVYKMYDKLYSYPSKPNYIKILLCFSLLIFCIVLIIIYCYING